jgi:hypothetical protein
LTIPFAIAVVVYDWATQNFPQCPHCCAKVRQSRFHDTNSAELSRMAKIFENAADAINTINANVTQ